MTPTAGPDGTQPPTAGPDRTQPATAANSSGPVSRAPVVVLVLGLALALGLVLFAALGRGPAPVVAVDHPGTPAAPREVTVIMRDYLFNPTPLVLVPGETVRFRIMNGGLQPHAFVLGDTAVQEAWARAEALATPAIPFATPPPASVAPDVGGLRVLLDSGEQAAADYAVPARGELRLVCPIVGHVEQGMIGRIELQGERVP